ncbi:DUF3742 family protein [Pseudomonas vanderleydeniana]|uniref:DUF3742 family protein n=1 Tax=Pseudomonas vanderleydeniana TaxID=2745495 RepID=A0A9E6PRI5_9PSED|nr:DUF3742 family protein [Pseudomonas vanderleydeniana]QXI31142.1 DUF3742 family protein [Pseudomonas vanderleydeniana]
MATEAKKKGLTYRIGFVFGGLSARYRRFEAPMLRWAIEKGMSATLASLLSGLVRLSLIGAFLYLAFWVVVAVIGVILCKELLLNSSGAEEEELVVFKADEVFPDPYSPENMSDPAFYREI